MVEAIARPHDRTQHTPMDLLAQCRVEPIIYDGVHPELCPALEQVILRRMQTHGGRRIGSLNVGGWKSTEDFFSWPDDAVQSLREVMVAHMGAQRLVGWAMVNRLGSHHPRHQHRAATLTGIYYVATGNPVTPTVYECEGESRYEIEVDPHPGRFVIFRGEMWHRVPVYPGEQPRITIAFDVRR